MAMCVAAAAQENKKSIGIRQILFIRSNDMSIKKEIRKSAAVLILSGLNLAGGLSFAAEFEVLDRFSVDGYTVIKGSADIPGGSFTVGGSAVVVKGGNVGIGTTAPGAALQVVPVTDGNPQLFLSRRSGDYGLQITAYSTINFMTKLSDNLTWQTFMQACEGCASGSSHLILQPISGNVGIGTTAPTYKLDVQGGIGRFTQNSATNSLYLQYNNSTAGVWLGSTAAGSGLVVARGNDSATIMTADSGLNVTIPNGVLTVSGAGNSSFAGNVGIGTTNPSTKLQIVGDTNALTLSRSATGPGGLLAFTDQVNTVQFRVGIENNANNFIIDDAANNRLTILKSNGNVGIGTTNPVTTLDIGGTGSIKIPVGTTAQRPASPVPGMMRFNTETGRLEVYNGSGWGVAATGGAESISGGYHLHTFTGSGTFTVTSGGNVEYLIVAGGGSGGNRHSGGGGGGGVLTGNITVFAQTYTITVGAGGSQPFTNTDAVGAVGGNTTALGFTAVGGGGGGCTGQVGTSGGSGGGHGERTGAVAAAAGTSGQGNNGGLAGTEYGGAGGGGGAGAAGGAGRVTAGVPGNGGIGVQSSISGTAVYYGGGGGGGGYTLGNTSSGGTGGGGAGGDYQTFAPATAGATNTGGGGGGGTTNGNTTNGAGGAGGSGIVIIRYPI